MNFEKQPGTDAFLGSSSLSGRLPEPCSLRFVKWWIWLSAFATVAGWSLSALGELNRTGYAIFFLSAAAGVILVVQKFAGPVAGRKHFHWRKIRARFRRLLPCAFGALAFLILLGGLLYAPSNYTGLAYRMGRVLQWLDHGHWWWIHTTDWRMNDRACGAEWLYVPVLLFTKSDRALFLINFLPYLLLPGLIFSVFTRLGVRERVAWHWMWLLPTGYNFLLQAGSIANDTFPTVYALAAFDFALRAWASRRASDWWYSLMAVALLTGAKASNLPLLLPWAVLAVALFPVWRRPLPGTALTLLVAAVVSFLPTAILNAIHCGDWSGAIIEQANMTVKNPWTGIWGNAFQLVLDNLVPPCLPMAGWWNAHAHSILPHFLVRAVAENFTSGYFMIGELPTEDWAGIGFGLSVLVLASVGAGLGLRAMPSSQSAFLPTMLRRGILAAFWLALLAYCVKSGMENAARIIAPYYPFLVASMVTGGSQSEVVRHRWWRGLALGSMALAFPVLVLSPDRPLWPAQTLLSRWVNQHPGSRPLSRAQEVYSIYRQRPDVLAGVRAMLPPDVQTIGLIAGKDDIDVSLWLPFGSRRVEYFLVSDPPEQIWTRVQYVVVGGSNLEDHNITIADWLRTAGAEVLATTNVTAKIGEGPQPWYVTREKE